MSFEIQLGLLIMFERLFFFVKGPFKAVWQIASEKGLGGIVYPILSKWYLLVAIPAMIIATRVLIILQEKGILDMVYNAIKENIDEINRIALKCTPKILDIHDFYNCL